MMRPFGSTSLPPPWSPVNWWRLFIVFGIIFISFLMLSDHLARSAIVTAFFVVWVALIFAAQQQPRLAAARVRGVTVLGWRPRYRFGFPSALVGPVLVLLLIAERPRNSNQALVQVIVFSFCVSGWLGLQQEARERFVLSDEGLERVSPWTGKRSALPWKSVTAIGWDGYHRFVMVSSAGRRLAVSHRIDGIGEFAATALRQLPEPVLQKAAETRAMLEEIASRLPSAR